MIQYRNTRDNEANTFITNLTIEVKPTLTKEIYKSQLPVDLKNVKEGTFVSLQKNATQKELSGLLTLQITSNDNITKYVTVFSSSDKKNMLNNY